METNQAHALRYQARYSRSVGPAVSMALADGVEARRGRRRPMTLNARQSAEWPYVVDESYVRPMIVIYSVDSP